VARGSKKGQPEVNFELAVAVAELAETQEFLMEISELAAQEMFEAIRKRDPAFIEHCEAMEQPPRNGFELWEGFGIWSITGLRSKYRHIWHKVARAYYKSPMATKQLQKARMWTAIEQILRDTRFE
jgi:hypothetical protein